jgi:ketosteroid isomerase-like protein
MFWTPAVPSVAAMEHTNATVARNLYASLAAGDVATVFDALSDDIVNLNDIGAGPWREVRGKQALLEFWGRWTELFDGTFRQDVLDVIGYDDRIVIVVHETGTAQGRQFDNRAIYLVTVEDGKWTELRTTDMDTDKINAFWAAVRVPELAGS